MGRRSIKTTKAGKFMNPTDQWRKEQRRRELKKNKKQRLNVREAVLRMKEPLVILEEIDEIERLEAEVSTPQPTDKSLQEKKRKLHASLDRIVKYYQKEDPKKGAEVKKLILDSEKKRRERSQLYNSYTAARSQINVEDIPMPDSMPQGLGDIPMPQALGLDEEREPGSLVPPPPPPGSPPPDLKNYAVIMDHGAERRRSIRFADEEDKEKEDDDDDGASESGSEDSSHDDSEEGEEFESSDQPSSSATHPALPPGPPPNMASYRHPPLPPPLQQQQQPTPLFSQQFQPPLPPRHMGGLSPGPPPGAPPPFGHPPPQPLLPANPSRPHIQSRAVISAPPSGATSRSESTPTGPVIQAQPQLRNMQAEVTKFMPTSLRVRRDQPKAVKAKAKLPSSQSGVSLKQPPRGDRKSVV